MKNLFKLIISTLILCFVSLPHPLFFHVTSLSYYIHFIVTTRRLNTTPVNVSKCANLGVTNRAEEQIGINIGIHHISRCLDTHLFEMCMYIRSLCYVWNIINITHSIHTAYLCILASHHQIPFHLATHLDQPPYSVPQINRSCVTPLNSDFNYCSTYCCKNKWDVLAQKMGTPKHNPHRYCFNYTCKIMLRWTCDAKGVEERGDGEMEKMRKKDRSGWEEEGREWNITLSSLLAHDPAVLWIE